MRKILVAVIIFGTCLTLDAGPVRAQDGGDAEVSSLPGRDSQNEEALVQPTPTRKPLKLPRSGVLATTIVTGGSSVQTDAPWGTAKQAVNMQAPVLGAVSKKEGNWMVKISNTSKDRTLNVNLELAQYNLNGQKVKSDPFSYSLRPGEVVERPVRAASNLSQVQLNLTDWKEQ